jgi:hypothetical protein
LLSQPGVSIRLAGYAGTAIASIAGRPSFSDRSDRRAFNVVRCPVLGNRIKGGITVTDEFYFTFFVTNSLSQGFIHMNASPKDI